ncbi:hypothetical protein [Actinophytocola oryzae]|uniref:Uncharacterized protein n=1 Tax=Actinophytocola oryzae TaxID=502181 RepID=A0A4R7VSV4_9PSEU|nr:hypothetical protein [Actinophytocola oryzae]TDV52297.1 hypothetical protein CLV71_105429 [Actinophytocola oryzae]
MRAIRPTAFLALLVAAMVALFVTPTASAAPAAPVAAPSVPLAGTFTDATGGVGTATGTFTPSQFVANGDQLLAQGVADVTLVDSAGQVVGSQQQDVSVPVDTTAIAVSCEILDLVLGPLDLDLLGLVVHLDRVHLNITAEGGPGNLLGNLLCAVANLLNGPSLDLNGLIALLNQILAILR